MVKLESLVCRGMPQKFTDDQLLSLIAKCPAVNDLGVQVCLGVSRLFLFGLCSARRSWKYVDFCPDEEMQVSSVAINDFLRSCERTIKKLMLPAATIANSNTCYAVVHSLPSCLRFESDLAITDSRGNRLLLR